MTVAIVLCVWLWQTLLTGPQSHPYTTHVLEGHDSSLHHVLSGIPARRETR